MNIDGTGPLRPRRNDVFPFDLQVDHIAGNDVGDENDQIVDFRNGLAFGSHVRNGYFFQQGKFFSFSCHFYTNLINFGAKIDNFPQISGFCGNNKDCNVEIAFFAKISVQKVL